MYYNEFEEIVENYDFVTMSPYANKMSFVQLLESWKKVQSVIINTIVSASCIKIATSKKNVAMFLREGLERCHLDGLRELVEKVRDVNKKYANNDMKRGKMENMTKLQRLKIIDKHDREIEDIVNKSPHCNIFKIMRLSSEYIDPVHKTRISKYCTDAVNNLVSNNPSSLNGYEDRTSLESQFKRRAMKIAVISLRKSEVVKFCADSSTYVLPRKG